MSQTANEVKAGISNHISYKTVDVDKHALILINLC